MLKKYFLNETIHLKKNIYCGFNELNLDNSNKF